MSPRIGPDAPNGDDRDGSEPPPSRIDQQEAASAVGLTMRPMTLIVFGNPKAGTPLMQAHPTLAIDLPLKALIWEDVHGQVWVSTNSPEYLQRRHAMAKTPFVGVPELLAQAMEASKTQPRLHH